MGMGGSSGNVPPQGLTPLQQANFGIGKNIVRGGKGEIGAMQDARQYGTTMSNMAQGGLLMAGLKQYDQAMGAPNLAPGIQSRMGSRMGVAASPEEQAAMQQQMALSNASNQVGMKNQVRAGLVNAQREMRFGGLGI
jgi:hypothetical protein